MIARGTGSALALTALLFACDAPPRGYYAPAGVEFDERIATHRTAARDAAIEVRAQGVYANDVDGDATATAHLQLEVTRPLSGDLVLERDGLVVETGTLTVPVSEVWCGREPVAGDLVVPGFSRRAYDLFFDDPALLRDGPPPALTARWAGRAGPVRIDGACAFTRIPPDDPRCPSGAGLGDPGFGLENGYYLPGDVWLGERGLVDVDEERLFYLHHRPGAVGWGPW